MTGVCGCVITSTPVTFLLTYPTFIILDLDLTRVTKFDYGSDGDVEFSTRFKVQPHVITLQQRKRILVTSKGNWRNPEHGGGFIHDAPSRKKLSGGGQQRQEPTCCTMTMFQLQVIRAQSCCREKKKKEDYLYKLQQKTMRIYSPTHN